MRRVMIFGDGAELAAAAWARSLAPAPVFAAYAGPSAESDFVTADGLFLPGAAFWLEWATGRPLLAAEPEDGPEESVLVVASPHAQADSTSSETIAASNLRVHTDRFGRPSLDAAGDHTTGGCRIGLLGDEHHHRHVYPAVLARLGDAAERTGIAVEPVIIPADDATIATGLAGVILPGGADLTQVAPQIALAEWALAETMPTLGLCLGMQSMTTALVRAAIWPDASFEEIEGAGPRRSFVRLQGPDNAGLHRLGEHRFQPAPDTRLARIMPDGAGVRMNHRYRFNPEIDAAAMAGGTFHWTDGILDAIEVPSHPFFIGLQGHPEIGCDPALAGLWDAFLRAAQAKDAAFAR